MKSLILVAGLVCVVAARPVAFAADDEVWFDMKNCAMCKHMGDHLEILHDMKWETHLTDNGFVSLTLIPEKHRKTMDGINKKMEGTIKKLESGEQLKLCGFCNSYGGLMQMGVKSQEIETSVGAIGIMTSDDEKVVEAIHKHAKRAMAEYEKWLKANSASKK